MAWSEWKKFGSLLENIEYLTMASNTVQQQSHTHSLIFNAPKSDFNVLLWHSASSGAAQITNYNISAENCDIDSTDALLDTTAGIRSFLLKMSNAVEGEQVKITISLTMNGAHYSYISAMSLT